MSVVIKEGDYTDPFKGMKFTCKNCKCEFELEGKQDVRRNYYEPDICITNCPTCGTKRTFADYSPWRS